MPKERKIPISLMLDPPTIRDLEQVAQMRGISVSEAARQAIAGGLRSLTQK